VALNTADAAHPRSALGRPARTWLALSHALRRWHRYEVTGLEHLPTDRSALIVGYHGRPMALDLVLLQSLIHDRLGYVPHAFAFTGLFQIPVLGRMFHELGMVTGDGPHLDAAVARGEHLIVTPGGTREGLRSHRDTYRVDWGTRRGYLKLALRLNLPIVPVGGAGMDQTWHGLFDGNAFAAGLPRFVPEPLAHPGLARRGSAGPGPALAALAGENPPGHRPRHPPPGRRQGRSPRSRGPRRPPRPRRRRRARPHRHRPRRAAHPRSPHMSDALLNILTEATVARLRAGYDYATMKAGFHRALFEPYGPGAQWVQVQVAHFYEPESKQPALGAEGVRRSVLKPVDREKVLIGLLAAEGGSALAIHLYWGIALGLEVTDAVDILFLAGTYTGVKAYNLSISVAARTFGAIAQVARARNPMPRRRCPRPTSSAPSASRSPAENQRTRYTARPTRSATHPHHTGILRVGTPRHACTVEAPRRPPSGLRRAPSAHPRPPRPGVSPLSTPTDTDGYSLGDDKAARLEGAAYGLEPPGGRLWVRTLPLLTALVVTLATFGIAWPFRDTAVGRHLLDRGFTQPLTVGLFGWGLGHVLARLFSQIREKRALIACQRMVTHGPLERRAVDHLAARLAPFATTLAGSVATAIVSYFTTQRPTRDEVVAIAHKAIDRCHDVVEAAYRPLGACMWLLPLSGFVGTVVGMAEAISGFDGLTEGAAPGLAALAGPIAGLGKAFDTTLLALVLVIPLKLFEVGLEGRDERLVDSIDRTLGAGYVLSLKLAGLAQQNPIEAVLDRYAERVERLERSLATIDRTLGDVATTLERMPGVTQALARTAHAAAAVEAALPEILDELRALRDQGDQPLTLVRGTPRRQG
jgi:1-acyl-sn-glycerol-3-phosphate acyltransferase/biopolymer transport protein ExbB/TolQ